MTTRSRITRSSPWIFRRFSSPASIGCTWAVLGLINVTTSCRAPPPPPATSCEEDWSAGVLRDVPRTTGDLTCVPQEGPLITGDADPTCRPLRESSGTTIDFQEQSAVGAVTLSFFEDSDLNLALHDDVLSDSEGRVAFTLAACTPFTYRADREGGLSTWGPHLVLGPSATDELAFQSITAATQGLLQFTFQVSVAAGHGNLYGLVHDCAGNPLENVQVIVRDAACQVPSSWIPGYYTDQFPDIFRAGTSSDGVFTAFDLPPGPYVAEAFVTETEGAAPAFRKIAAAPVTIHADQVVVMDLYAGRGDGVHYPAGCTPCP